MAISMGQKIYILRTLRGWSRADLSERAKVSVGAITKIETGAVEPKITTLEKIASGFEISVSDLLKLEIIINHKED